MDSIVDRVLALPREQRHRLEDKLWEWLSENRIANGNAKRISVFYVAKNPVSAEEMRSFLQQRLPDYMLPAEYISLAKLPKNTNGKVDRPALQRLEAELPQGIQTGNGYRNENEQRMGEIWSRILKSPDVGSDSNFFRLGGHSLLATQMIVEIEKAFGVAISLGAVFRYPTVAALSAHLAEIAPAGREVDVSEPAGRPQNVPVSDGQRRLWYASQLNSNGVEYKLLKVVELHGRLNVAALTQAVSEIANRHEPLRAGFVYADGVLVQRVHPHRPLPIEHVDLGDPPSSAVERLCTMIQNQIIERAFELETGPVFRVTLVKCSPACYRLIVDVHHIAVDGWSFGILVRELNALLRCYSKGTPGDLPSLPRSYGQVITQDRRRLAGPALDRQLAFWRSRLAALPKVEFRTGRPVKPGKDGEVQINIAQEVGAAINAACRQMQVTPFIWFLSSYHVLLQTYSGSADIAIGTDVANRDSADRRDLIGFFVNHIALRIAADEAWTFAQLCEAARTVSVEAFANKDVPVGAVLRALQLDRESTLFNTMFTFHHNLPDIDIEAIQVRMVNARPPVTRYSSLVLNMEEAPEGYTGSIEFAGDLFDESTAQQIATDFETLCGLAARDLGITVRNLQQEMVSAREEREQAWISDLRARRQQDLAKLVAASTAVSSPV